MTEVLPGVHATRANGGIVVEACAPDPFYRLTLDPSIPDRDMWFVFTVVRGKVSASYGLSVNFSSVPDPLGWARKWIVSEEFLVTAGEAS